MNSKYKQKKELKMERRGFLVALSLSAASLMMSGCAGAFANSMQTAKSTDNLNPTQIKNITDSHYLGDGLFAILNVSSVEEAEKQAGLLLGRINNNIIDTCEAYNKEQAKKLGRYKYKVEPWTTQAKGVDKVWGIYSTYYETVFARAGDAHGYPRSLSRKSQYIAFGVAKINDIYFLSVRASNAKNVSFGRKILDVFVGYAGVAASKANANSPQEMSAAVRKEASLKYNDEDDNNEQLMSVVGPALVASASPNFVNISLGSKDPRAEQYRNIYINYFK